MWQKCVPRQEVHYGSDAIASGSIFVQKLTVNPKAARLKRLNSLYFNFSYEIYTFM